MDGHRYLPLGRRVWRSATALGVLGYARRRFVLPPAWLPACGRAMRVGSIDSVVWMRPHPHLVKRVPPCLDERRGLSLASLGTAPTGRQSSPKPRTRITARPKRTYFCPRFLCPARSIAPRPYPKAFINRITPSSLDHRPAPDTSIRDPARRRWGGGTITAAARCYNVSNRSTTPAPLGPAAPGTLDRPPSTS